MRRRLLENGEGGYTPDFGEYHIVALYDVQDISTQTPLIYDKGSVSKMEIDGVVQATPVLKYQFTETGIHEAKFKVTTYIGYMFQGIKTVVEIYLSDYITEIGSFSYCSNLSKLSLTDNLTGWTGGGMFISCTKLKEIYIPEGTHSLGDSRGYGGSWFKRSGLTGLVIPSTVTVIYGNFSSYITNCESIICKPTTPPTLLNTIELPKEDTLIPFESTNNCPIYVPAESVEAYKTANRWTDYLASRIFPMPT